MELWQYRYNLAFWNTDLQTVEKAKGIIAATSMKDAFDKLSNYYLSDSTGEDFDFITIESKENGEISKNCVYEWKNDILGE